MNSNPYAYETDLSRSQGEFAGMIGNMQARLDALQKPALLEKAKAMKKRGQDLAKKAQDVQSSIELGLGAPLGPVVSKNIIQPASKYAGKVAKKYLGDRVEKAGEKIKGVAQDLKSKAEGLFNRGSAPIRGVTEPEPITKGGEFGANNMRDLEMSGKEARFVATPRRLAEGEDMESKYDNQTGQPITEVDETKSSVAEGKDSAGEAEDFTRPGESALGRRVGGGRVDKWSWDEDALDSAPTRAVPTDLQPLHGGGEDDFVLEAPTRATPEAALAPTRAAPEATAAPEASLESNVGKQISGLQQLGSGPEGAVNAAKGITDPAEALGTVAQDGVKPATKALVAGAEELGDDTVDATLGAVAGANAFDPIGWVIGAGLAIGGLVEGISSMADSAKANTQEKVAAAIPLPKSPPINFAGKLVVPVNSAVGQE